MLLLWELCSGLELCGREHEPAKHCSVEHEPQPCGYIYFPKQRTMTKTSPQNTAGGHLSGSAHCIYAEFCGSLEVDIICLWGFMSKLWLSTVISFFILPTVPQPFISSSTSVRDFLFPRIPFNMPKNGSLCYKVKAIRFLFVFFSTRRKWGQINNIAAVLFHFHFKISTAVGIYILPATNLSRYNLHMHCICLNTNNHSCRDWYFCLLNCFFFSLWFLHQHHEMLCSSEIGFIDL